jgi:hypothetical protein
MAEKKQRNPRFASPKGRFIYPWLSTPDTKFDDDGVYRVKVSVPAAEAAEAVEMLEKVQAEHLANNKAGVEKEGSLPWSLDEETNEYVFSFKMNAIVRTKKGDTWTQRPAIFDSSGVPCKDLKIGGGTIGRVSYEIIPYANKQLGAGISLRMKAVQIHELVEYGAAGADAYGFDEEGEGFKADAGTDFDEESAEGTEENYKF